MPDSSLWWLEDPARIQGRSLGEVLARAELKLVHSILCGEEGEPTVDAAKRVMASLRALMDAA